MVDKVIMILYFFCCLSRQYGNFGQLLVRCSMSMVPENRVEWSAIQDSSVYCLSTMVSDDDGV